MRVACVGYRGWSLNIYDRLARATDDMFLIIRSKAQFDETAIKDFRPDLVLFYGWSWIVPPSLIDGCKCLMLHPSPLPLYRGGSPIQNQIIAGEKDSKVTIFIMNDEIDAGDIVAQTDLSLSGSLDDIFGRIEEAGFQLTLNILRNGYVARPQNQERATKYRRRTPAESQITLEELTSSTALHLYNKIRMLADPYPNAFIKTADGLRLLIKSAEIAGDSEPENTSRHRPPGGA